MLKIGLHLTGLLWGLIPITAHFINILKHSESENRKNNSTSKQINTLELPIFLKSDVIKINSMV
jgi:hypothetical protein